MRHSSCYNTLINNTVNSNGGGGIYLYNLCNYNNIIDNTVNSNTCMYGGITVYSSSNNMVTGNTVINNTPYTIHMRFANDNLIYNNYFANNADTFSGSNIWNTTPTTGPNIIGGPEIGGNYWGNYAGADGDGDGFGDEPYNIPGCSNRDHLPLVLPLVLPLCGDITGDGTIDTVDLMRLLRRVVTGTPLANDCVCDIDGSGTINALDARLLMGYIHDPGGIC